MKIYGLADIDGMELVVNKETCTALEALDIKYIIKENSNLCVLRNARIESKIGVEFLIKTEDGKRIRLPKGAITLGELPSSGITINQYSEGEYKITNGNNHIKNLRLYVIYVSGETNKIIKEELLFSTKYLEMKKTVQIGAIEFPEERSDLRLYFEIRIKNEKRNYYQRYRHIEN